MSTFTIGPHRNSFIAITLTVAAATVLAVGYSGYASRVITWQLVMGERATPAPFVVERGKVFEFELYANDAWGFKLAVPRGAIRSERGDAMSFAYSDDALINGRFIVDVERLPSSTGSPDQALEALSGGLRGLSDIEKVTADGGNLVGALRTYLSGPGIECGEVRAVLAVFVNGPFTYALRVSSDAANRCDTRALPQTAGVINSLRLESRP